MNKPMMSTCVNSGDYYKQMKIWQEGRIDQLEKSIASHKKRFGAESTVGDRELWAALDEQP